MAFSSTRPILINGAGIAGLTAALCLAQAGHSVVVYEKAEGFETIGAGVQLSPNATRVLIELGLGRQLEALATIPERIDIRNGITGNSLARIPLGRGVQQKYGVPYYVIHRSDLQMLLFNRCKNDSRITIHFSQEIVEMAPHQRGVTASILEDSEVNERIAEAVLVADGVWSRLRQSVLKLEGPQYSGKIAWRALLPMSELDADDWQDRTRVWFGPQSHVVTYPVRNGNNLNLVIITDGPEASAGEKLTTDANHLQSLFKNWKGDFIPLLERKTRWTGWPLFEMASAKPMHFGAVGLIGDAAHAMLPFAAQGAAMAIEDASVLGACFKSHDSAHSAMQAYAKQRIKRVNQVMSAARKNGKIYHMSGISSDLRDLGMWLTPNAILAKRQDWIYGWKG